MVSPGLDLATEFGIRDPHAAFRELLGPGAVARGVSPA